jgi:hypothetical protein
MTIVFLARLASLLSTTQKLMCIEFDCGGGRSITADMPHYFRDTKWIVALWSGNLNALSFVIGNIKQTCATFLQDYDPAPIGCMFHDSDFYSSTRDALTLLDMDFDDIVGDDLCNEVTGQRLGGIQSNPRNKENCEELFRIKKSS